MKNRKRSENKNHCMTTGMCMGIAIGTVLGTAMDKLTVYMPIGLAVGMCVGTLFYGNNQKKDEDDMNDED